MSDLVLDERGVEHGAKSRRVQPYFRMAARVLLVCAGYYVGGIVGIKLMFPLTPIAIIWPPNAILLATLLLTPTRTWWLYLLAVIPTHFHLVENFQPGVPVVTVLCQAFGNIAQAGIAAVAVRRFASAPLRLDNLQSVTAFTLLAAVAAPGVVAALVAYLFIVTGWVDDFWMAWRLRFLANAFAALTITPLIVLAVNRGAAAMREASLRRYAEFGLLVIALFAVGIPVFGMDAAGPRSYAALLYAPLPLLLWAAVRFGPGGLCLSLLVVAFLSLSNAIAGRGPFIIRSPAENVFWLQIFLLAISLPLMLLAAVVAERRDKEKALRESEARYRAVVEDQTELICRFLPDGTYTFVNGAYCRYFHTSPEELLGRSFWAFIPQEGHQAAREFLASITPEHPVATREHEVVAPGGELRWQQWRDRGFFDDHGRVLEYQAVGRDITERKHVEEAMQNLAHVGRLAVVGELTGSIAHEISQPLTAILSNAEVADMQLQSESPSLEEVRTILADIRNDDLRASDVIRRIRALLRKRELVMSALSLNEVAAEVVRLVSADARRRKVALETEFAAELADIRGDRVHLQQVLLNLILNGMEAMADTPEARRRIVVRTDRSGDQSVRVSVSDAGDGIPADRLPRVFESFFTTKEDGMGLGLAICRSIVEVHGGHIWAENHPDGGATFHFTLPVAA